MKTNAATDSNDDTTNNNILQFDKEKLREIRDSKAWMHNPKYFKNVQVSPCATMKMLQHANAGVEKGMRSQGRKPVEVMGLILGRPSTDPSSLNTLVVTDVYPLPVEGAETRVLADDDEVINYMISLGESLEITRSETFMGWYHSHPFDVEINSHCFLSSTDVSTQLQWQRAEDPHGNPWLAIVIDPLRSVAKGRPEMESFRVYPVDYTAPDNETPDGAIVSDQNARLERWGSCWNRYYTLEMNYVMHSFSSSMMNILSEQFMWMRTLDSTPMLERENRERFSERITSLSGKVHDAAGTVGRVGNRHGRSQSGGGSATTGADKKCIKSLSNESEEAMEKVTKVSCDLAIEQSRAQMTQLLKQTLFNGHCKC